MPGNILGRGLIFPRCTQFPSNWGKIILKMGIAASEP